MPDASTKQIEKLLLRADKIIRRGLSRELRDQGHRLEGALEQSFAGEIVNSGGQISLVGTGNAYGQYLNFGVVPSRVPFRFGSGAGQSEYINGLISFFKKRGLDDTNAKAAAFATARKQSEEGMPTQGSYRHSSNGERLGFIDAAAETINDELTDTMSFGLMDIMSAEFHKTKSETI